jgi:hypothetical protein
MEGAAWKENVGRKQTIRKKKRRNGWVGGLLHGVFLHISETAAIQPALTRYQQPEKGHTAAINSFTRRDDLYLAILKLTNWLPY